MNTKQWLRLIASTLLLVVLIILPFLPGRSNNLVVFFSTMTQFLGVLGIFLIPIGAIWLAIEIINSKRNDTRLISWKIPFALALLALLIIAAFYFLIVYFTIAAPIGPGTPSWLSGITGIVVGIIALLLSVRGLKGIRRGNFGRFRVAPIYLIILPVVAFLCTRFVVRPLSDYSRNYAIEKSETIITAIEEYKNVHGTYPSSLDELKSTVKTKPAIMGIRDFRYNKIGESYSLSFSQWLEWGSLEQIVLFDKSGVASIHQTNAPYDYQSDLHRVKGAFASFDTKYPYWRYYDCD